MTNKNRESNSPNNWFCIFRAWCWGNQYQIQWLNPSFLLKLHSNGWLDFPFDLIVHSTLNEFLGGISFEFLGLTIDFSGSGRTNVYWNSDLSINDLFALTHMWWRLQLWLWRWIVRLSYRHFFFVYFENMLWISNVIYSVGPARTQNLLKISTHSNECDAHIHLQHTHTHKVYRNDLSVE